MKEDDIVVLRPFYNVNSRCIDALSRVRVASPLVRNLSELPTISGKSTSYDP